MEPFEWIMLIMFIASVAMMATQHPKRQQAQTPRTFADINFPQATTDSPIPIVIGTVRLKGINTLWSGDFTADGIWSKGSHGFLGIGGVKAQITGYHYKVGLDIGLCVSRQTELVTIWAGKYLLYQSPDSSLTNLTASQVTQGLPQTGPVLSNNAGVAFNINCPNLFSNGGSNTITLGSLGGQVNTTPTVGSNGGMSGDCVFYNGSFFQPRDAYLTTKVDPNVPAYRGIAHLVMKHFYIGDSTNLEALNFELRCITNYLGLPGSTYRIGTYDQNPAEALYWIMTQKWGGAGLPTSVINTASFLACGATLYAEGLGCSMTIDSSNKLKDAVVEIMKLIDGILYEDPTTGKICMKLIRNDYDISTIPVLDESSVIELKGYAIQPWADVFNTIRVKFQDRAQSYADTAAVDQDFAGFNRAGRRKIQEIGLTACHDPVIAQRVAAREKSKVTTPIYKAQIVVNRKASSFLPGSVFKLNWPDYSFSNLVFRVLKVDMGSLVDGKITVDVIQDIYAANQIILAPPSPSSWIPINASASPIVNSYIDEAPWWIINYFRGAPTAGKGQLLALPVRPATFSSTFYGIDSNDSFSTQFSELVLTAYPVSAVLSLGYNVSNPETNYDTSIGVKISGVTDPSILSTAIDADLRVGKNLFAISGEWFNYSDFVDNGDGTYLLKNVRRGLIDTAPLSHSPGEYVYFATSLTSTPADYIFPSLFATGTTIKAKPVDSSLLSTYPEASQASTTVVLNSRVDRPLRPGHLTADGVASPSPGGATVTLAWRERLRISGSLYWEDDATATPEASTSYVVRTNENNTTWVEHTIAAGTTTYTYTYLSYGTVIAVEVYAVLGGLRSWTPARLNFTFLDPGLGTNAIETRTALDLVLMRGGNLPNWR